MLSCCFSYALGQKTVISRNIIDTCCPRSSPKDARQTPQHFGQRSDENSGALAHKCNAGHLWKSPPRAWHESPWQTWDVCCQVEENVMQNSNWNEIGLKWCKVNSFLFHFFPNGRMLMEFVRSKVGVGALPPEQCSHWPRRVPSKQLVSDPHHGQREIRQGFGKTALAPKVSRHQRNQGLNSKAAIRLVCLSITTMPHRCSKGATKMSFQMPGAVPIPVLELPAAVKRVEKYQGSINTYCAYQWKLETWITRYQYGCFRVVPPNHPF